MVAADPRARWSASCSPSRSRSPQNSDQILYFTAVKPTGAPEWLTLPLIFAAVAAVMMCLGEGVGRLFPHFPALTAYRLDLIGSLVGIAIFTALSFLDAPPLGGG